MTTTPTHPSTLSEEEIRKVELHADAEDDCQFSAPLVRRLLRTLRATQAERDKARLETSQQAVYRTADMRLFGHLETERDSLRTQLTAAESDCETAQTERDNLRDMLTAAEKERDAFQKISLQTFESFKTMTKERDALRVRVESIEAAWRSVEAWIVIDVCPEAHPLKVLRKVITQTQTESGG